MKSRKRYLPYILIALLDLIGLLLFINTFDPKKNIDAIIANAPPIPIFFILAFIFISCIFTFILKSKRRGIFIGILSISILLLQFFRVINLFFIIILIIIFVLLEILFIKKKE